ncbi:MAG: glycosyltransferase [Patescibacteria group bacterium]
MKLIYFANIRLPTEKAYGIQIMKMCDAFSHAGAEVTLVIPTRANPGFNGVNPFDYYGVKRSFALQRIKTFDPWWLIRLPQGIYIKVQGFLFIFKLYLWFFIHNIYSKYDVAYTRDEYLLPLLHKFFPRVVWEAHNLPSHPQRYIKAWRKCRYIVAITKGLKDALVKQGVHPDHIMVAPDGVDLEKFTRSSDRVPSRMTGQVQPFDSAQGDRDELRRQLGLPTDKKIILYSGHLYERKGAQMLADAIRLLDDRFLAVIVGGTPHDIERFAIRNMDTFRIKIVGYQPHALIPRYLNAADALVLPNSAKNDDAKLFTSPMKLFEYMTAHAPLIASRVPALQEILNDHNAVFFNPDDPRDLANVIQKVIDNPDLYNAYWQQANKDVMQYTWLKRAQRIFTTIIK